MNGKDVGLHDVAIALGVAGVVPRMDELYACEVEWTIAEHVNLLLVEGSQVRFVSLPRDGGRRCPGDVTFDLHIVPHSSCHVVYFQSLV